MANKSIHAIPSYIFFYPYHTTHTTHSNPTNPPGWPPPDVASDWMDRCEAPRPGLGPGLGSFRPQGFVGCWEGRWFHVWIYLVALKYRVFHGCWKKNTVLYQVGSSFITPGKSPFQLRQLEKTNPAGSPRCFNASILKVSCRRFTWCKQPQNVFTCWNIERHTRHYSV